MSKNQAEKKNHTDGSVRKNKKEKDLVLEIDLPGQPIQCWTTDVEKITVILRKHRDVIFDIDMAAGKTYTIWSDQSEMYDAKNKKLIHPRETRNFKDGELLHLWVARDFKGKIFLYEGANLRGAYNIPKLNVGIESFDPAVKPAPINIMLKAAGILGDAKAFNVMQPDGSLSIPEGMKNAEHDKFLQVVELNEKCKNLPQEIADFFMHGGEKEIFLSGGVVTRNWLWNQVAAQTGYVVGNFDWMKELFGERVTIRTVDHAGGRKMYVFLTGSTRHRLNLPAHRYSSMSTKVMGFTFGAGSAAGLRHASWGAVKGNFRGPGLVVILLTISLDVAEWMLDYRQSDPITGKPKQDLTDLFIKIGIDVTKNLISSAMLNYGFGLALLAAGTASIALIVAGTIVLTVLFSYGVDLLDKEYRVSEKIASAIKGAPAFLEKKMEKDYRGFAKAIDQAVKFGGFEYDSSKYPVR